MARPVSDEELQLKKRARRRLVGAIVLVTAVAVVLPMVLDSEPKSVSQNIDVRIPATDSGEFKPKGAASAPADAKSAKAAPAATAKSDDPPVSPIAEPSPTGAPVTTEPPKETAKAPATRAPAETVKEPAKTTASAAAKESREAPSAAAGAYVVQVAALSDTAKAKLLEKQMASAGLKTYTEVVNTQSGEVMRVRAGPYPTREAAEKARTQLKKAGLDGKVVPK